MKKIQLYKYLYFTIFFLAGNYAKAQFTDSKDYHKAIALSPQTKVSISNKHGNINVISWDKDSLVVSAKISGSSKSLYKLQETMAATSIDFRKNGEAVSISTFLSQTSLNQSLSKIKSAAGISNSIKIEYTISMPASARLAIFNKYGDVYIEDHKGELSMEISHGNLRANTLNKVQYLRSNFGNIYIAKVAQLKGNLLFSELEIEEAKELDISSKSTTYDLGSIALAYINTSNDKINITKAGIIDINGNLSKIKISKLTDEADVKLNYGKLTIRRIETSVCTLDISSQRTTIDLGFHPDCKYSKRGVFSDSEVNGTDVLDRISSGTDDTNKCTLKYNCQKSKIYFR